MISSPATRSRASMEASVALLKLSDGHTFSSSAFLRRFTTTITTATTTTTTTTTTYHYYVENSLLPWNAKITDRMRGRDARGCLDIIRKMCQIGINPDAYTISSSLKASVMLGDLEIGRLIHALFIMSVTEASAYVNSTLINMYAKLGNLEDARYVFEKVSDAQDIVSWNAMITGYTKHGFAEDAVNLYKSLNYICMQPTDITFTSALHGCACLESLECGRQIHRDILVMSTDSNIYVNNILIDMYTKCGSLEDALKVFDDMPEHDVVSWNAMIAAFSKNGLPEKAFLFFVQMLNEGMRANDRTFVNILNACKAVEYLEQCHRLHTLVEESELRTNVIVCSTMMDMYMKCNEVNRAELLFKSSPKLDVVTWNVIIAANAKKGNFQEALELHERMKLQGIMPNEVTFLGILHACGGLAALERGRQVHACITTCMNHILSLCNGLIDMYVKCRSLHNACSVFSKMSDRDVVSWTATITGYAQQEQQEHAFLLYIQMQQESILPNKITFLALLSVIHSPVIMKRGRQIHCQIEAAGMKHDLTMTNTLIHMYANCGKLNMAQDMFDETIKNNVITWNAMISGYAKYGRVEESWELFCQMGVEGVFANETTFASILDALSSIASSGQGKQIHTVILSVELQSSIFIGSALINMYSKCGNLDHAHKVLDGILVRDVGSWGALITAYAQHGHGKKTLQLAAQMCAKGIQLNHITLISILSACSHSGLLNEGWFLFDSMTRDHGVKPTVKHFSCMVDLLGRAGQLEDAYTFIQKLPPQASAPSWMSLLSSCRMYGNVDIAEVAAERIHQLEPQNAAPFQLLHDIYASPWQMSDFVDMLHVNNECMQTE